MKKGQFFILVIICAIVGMAGWQVLKNQKADWEKPEGDIGQLLFPDFPINDIRKLTISSKEKNVELTKESEFWVVNNSYSYYADFSKVADFLKKVNDLKVLQKIDIEADDLGRLELNEPDQESQTGTKIEFFDKNDTMVGKLVLGKNHMRKASGRQAQFGGGEYPDGRYVLQAKNKTIALVSETFSSISDDSDSWLDKTFIKVENIKSATLKNEDQISWEIYREKEKGPLKLKGEIGSGEEIENSKLNSIDSSLKYANFNKVADPASSDEKISFSEGYTYVAETFDGFVYTIDIGNKIEDGDYPLKVNIAYSEPALPEGPEGETEEAKTKREEEFKASIVENQEKYKNESERYANWVYLISSYTIDNLLIERKDLLKKREPKEDNKKASINEKASLIPPGPLPPPGLLQKSEGSGSPSIPKFANDKIDEVSKAIHSVTDDIKEKTKTLEGIVNVKDGLDGMTKKAEEKSEEFKDAIEGFLDTHKTEEDSEQ